MTATQAIASAADPKNLNKKIKDLENKSAVWQLQIESLAADPQSA